MDRQTAIQTNVFSLIAGCGDLWVVSGTRAGFIIWLHLARLIACLQLKGFNKQTAIGLDLRSPVLKLSHLQACKKYKHGY